MFVTWLKKIPLKKSLLHVKSANSGVCPALLSLYPHPPAGFLLPQLLLGAAWLGSCSQCGSGDAGQVS